jgi:hypothetical protein
MEGERVNQHHAPPRTRYLRSAGSIPPLPGERLGVASRIWPMNPIALDELVGTVPHPTSHAVVLKQARAHVRDLATTLLARQDLCARRFGELLPGIEVCPGPEPVDRGLSTRAQNLLGRSPWGTWAGLADATPLLLSGLPNLGAKSFIEIVQMVLAAWIDFHATRDPDIAVARAAPARDALANDAEVGECHSAHPLLAVLPEAQRALCWAWGETGATTLGEALSSLATAHLPPDILAVRQELLAADLSGLLGRRPPNEASWQRVLRLDCRERNVAAARIFPSSSQRPTLDELGGRFGVTRERIRQIENAVKVRIGAQIASDDGADIRHLAARLRAAVGAVVEPDQLAISSVELVAESSAHIDTAEAALRSAILIASADTYCERSGLLFSSHAAEVLMRTERTLALHPPAQVIDPSLLEEALTIASGAPHLTDRVLAHLGVRLLDGKFVVWRGGQADKAVAVLAAREETMSMAEIHEAVGFDVNPRSLAGRVQSEPRIMRRGKDSYGLREWAGEEYSGILEELEQAIERAGGSVDLEEIVQLFVAEFGVTANSVRSYASGRRFVRTADGRIAMRGADDPEPAIRHHPVHGAAGAFLIDGVWHARFEIDHDILRGSGRPIRQAIATELGLEPDLTIGFIYDGETVVFTWGASQPTMGSIRGLVRTHGCSEGDVVFLPLTGDEPRRARVSRGVDLRRESGVRRLAVEVGLDADDADEDEQPVAIAEALGLPAGADWIDIADRIRDRGDRYLLELVPSAGDDL